MEQNIVLDNEWKAWWDSGCSEKAVCTLDGPTCTCSYSHFIYFKMMYALPPSPAILLSASLYNPYRKRGIYTRNTIRCHPLLHTHWDGFSAYFIAPACKISENCNRHRNVYVAGRQVWFTVVQRLQTLKNNNS